MKHLAKTGTIVHLDLDFSLIEKRVKNLDSRGIVMAKGQTLRSLYNDRHPLYQKYADITIDCDQMNHDQVVSAIIKAMA